MCIIASLPKGSPLDRVESMLSVLRTEWTHNRDGAGFMFARDGVLTVRRGYFNRGRFIRALRRAIRVHGANEQSDVIAHLRYATHGAKNAANTHPHMMGSDKRAAMVHNGILHGFGTPGPNGVSDSADYAARVLGHLTARELLHPQTVEWVSKNIGGSKMVFLADDGTAAIVNPQFGTTHEGVWYSDPSIGKPEPAPVPVGFAAYWSKWTDGIYRKNAAAGVFGPKLPDDTLPVARAPKGKRKRSKYLGGTVSKAAPSMAQWEEWWNAPTPDATDEEEAEFLRMCEEADRRRIARDAHRARTGFPPQTRPAPVFGIIRPEDRSTK